MTMRSTVVLGLVCLLWTRLGSLSDAFGYNSKSSTAGVRRLHQSYGKGADIWPPSNEGPVRLTDSFPNGQLPPQVLEALQLPNVEINDATTTTAATAAFEVEVSGGKKRTRWRKVLPRAVERILRRAARQEKERTSRALDRTPVIVALALLSFVQPIDVLIVTFFSGYFCLLTQLARSSNGGPPTLPALPPQGHVPVWFLNPLGYRITNSLAYDRWLRLGVVTGIMAPVAWIIRHTLFKPVVDSAVSISVDMAARPLFLLCCQAVSESVSRNYRFVPLPIRILIPVAYNTVRIAYLWQWALAPATLQTAERVLAVTNLLYWSLNLFVFLLPVAVIKYMRAHFFCVEAEEVTTRAGMEETLGLSSPTTPYYYY